MAAVPFRSVILNTGQLVALLASAPREFTEAARTANVQLELPWPDGGSHVFRIEESPIMEPALAAEFPALQTYRGQGVDDPTATLRFDWTPSGFHALVLSADGTVYIDPVRRATWSTTSRTFGVTTCGPTATSSVAV